MSLNSLSSNREMGQGYVDYILEVLPEIFKNTYFMLCVCVC